MQIVAFAASSSTRSINKKLITYATSLMPQHQVEILDLNDFELPLFSEDRELELGQPDLAKQFLHKLDNADALLVSFAEHNGSYSATYKSPFDWCSRINTKVFQGKDMVVLSTSPGKAGGKNVMAAALNSIPHFGGNILGSLSVPSFYDNFDTETMELNNEEYKQKLNEQLSHFSRN